MKKVTLLAAAMILIATSIHAQSKKNEIDLGVGLFSSNQIVGIMSEVIVSGLTGLKTENGSYIGAWHLGYKHSVSDRFALGPVLAFDRGTSDILANNLYIGSSPGGKFTGNYFSLAIEGDYKYINSDNFKLYSLAGVGATLLNQVYKPDAGENKSQIKAFFAGQITPIGVKFGNSFGIFGELGFGYKGIICVGVFGRF